MKFLRRFTKNGDVRVEGGGGSGWRCSVWGGGGLGGCKQRIEVFVKIQKRGVGGVRVDVIEELKCLENFTGGRG